ncbi:hypothetical protein C1645_827321 [Glomus cerebriforme]|uniref:Uncharacterized protein n=1 Tax=Glomus cerebriforme TaxID=658196 RepID=A0A397SS42_9GLOM|nr:hypothetical protein C1645_827321 [Glomus cerebriforme]
MSYSIYAQQILNVVQPQGPKQKYGFDMGYAKKALDLTIRADKVDEFVNQIEYFIESIKAELYDQQENVISIHIGDLLRVRHKGRQPNKYKLCGELQKKKIRHVQDITNITNKDYKEEVVANQEENMVARKARNDAAEILVLLSEMGERVNITLRGIDKENKENEEDYRMELEM